MFVHIAKKTHFEKANKFLIEFVYIILAIHMWPVIGILFIEETNPKSLNIRTFNFLIPF